jgi:hypothetical protein
LPYLIQLKSTESGQSLRTTSSADGSYSFSALAPGNYVVEIEVGPDRGYASFPARQFTSTVQTGVALDESKVQGADFGILPLTRVPRFIGSVTIDGMRASTAPVVEAFVGGKNCGAPIGVLPPDVGVSIYHIAVAPAELIPGCGVPGSTVTFKVNGRSANETASWHPAGNPLAEGLSLTVGSAPPPSSSGAPSRAAPFLIGPPLTGDAGLRRPVHDAIP